MKILVEFDYINGTEIGDKEANAEAAITLIRRALESDARPLKISVLSWEKPTELDPRDWK